MSSTSRKYRIHREADVPEIRLPKCWLADLIHSQMATGNFGRMARDAIAMAQQHGRKADETLYRNMLDQIGDYWAQRDR
jgi:hypothetical protein